VHRVLFNVLPRQASSQDLAALVQRLHGKHLLLGSPVNVQAPNTPELARCLDCSELGHTKQACPLYQGHAIRLLFKNTVSFARKEQLQRELCASSSFLSHGVNEQAPHRKVTLLFVLDPANEDDLRSLHQRLVAWLRLHQSLLHAFPRLVNVAERHKECKECGFLGKGQQPAHVCPLAPPSFAGQLKRSYAQHQQQPRSQQPKASGRGAPAPGAAAPAAAPRNIMCRSWRKDKTCARKSQGLHCSWEHPSDFVPRHCHDFVLGNCNRPGTCIFPHLTHEQLHLAPAPAVAAPTAAAAPVAAAPAAAAPVAAARALPAQARTAPALAAAHVPAARAPVAAAAAAGHTVHPSRVQQVPSAAAAAPPAVIQPLPSLAPDGDAMAVDVAPTPATASKKKRGRPLERESASASAAPLALDNAYSALSDDDGNAPVRASSLSTLRSPNSKKQRGDSSPVKGRPPDPSGTSAAAASSIAASPVRAPSRSSSASASRHSAAAQ
jgi:hypothetical protein